MNEYPCHQCGCLHDNFHSSRELGLCEVCREKAFNTMRKTRVCCRCSYHVEPFTPKNDVLNRMLVCYRCGLTISRLSNDVVRSKDGPVIEDWAAKSSHIGPKKRTSPGRPRGGNNLSVEDVREIRRDGSVGRSPKDIAAQYGITTKHVKRIISRRAWIHV